MSKKILSIALAITMVAALFCVGALSASADEAVHAGDQVRYVFSISPLTDVGGLTVYSNYDASKLTYVSSEYVYPDGMGAVNDLNAGSVNWNDTFAQGLNTSNTDIFAVTYNVIADGDVSGLGLFYNCIELFDVNAIDIPGDFNSLVNARVEVIHNETTDSEDTDSEPQTEVDTDSGETSSTTSSEVSSTVSSNTSSSTSSTPKKDTPDTSKPTSSTISTPGSTSTVTSSNASSSAASSSKPASSSKASSTSSTVPAVKTAGTVAIISLVVVLMAAAAVVFFSKKHSAEE